MPTRRRILEAGALTLAGLALPYVRRSAAAAAVVEIRMKSDRRGVHVGFDPIGILVEPGTVLRWVLDANVHTTTAYHPRNDNHSLRIPEGAEPWNSDYLVNAGDHFDMRLTVEGVYDYFCVPHEQAGMVGRIIVGRPAGPGTLPFDYFKSDPAKASWQPVPEAAQKAFPPVEAIIAQRIVRLGPLT